MTLINIEVAGQSVAFDPDLLLGIITDTHERADAPEDIHGDDYPYTLNLLIKGEDNDISCIFKDTGHVSQMRAQIMSAKTGAPLHHITRNAISVTLYAPVQAISAQTQDLLGEGETETDGDRINRKIELVVEGNDKVEFFCQYALDADAIIDELSAGVEAEAGDDAEPDA